MGCVYLYIKCQQSNYYSTHIALVNNHPLFHLTAHETLWSIMKVEKIDKVLRRKEVANVLSVSPSTVWRWEKAGIFPKRIRYGPNVCGWRESRVKKWLSEKDSHEV